MPSRKYLLSAYKCLPFYSCPKPGKLVVLCISFLVYILFAELFVQLFFETGAVKIGASNPDPPAWADMPAVSLNLSVTQFLHLSNENNNGISFIRL